MELEIKFNQKINYKKLLNAFTIKYDKFIVKKDNECWDWLSTKRYDGYGAFKFKSKFMLIHRVSWMIYRGKIPKGKLVLHKCDNRICSNPEHLFLGTYRDNYHDMVAKKRNNSFIDNMFKLNESDVRNIKILLKKGETMVNIGKKFNVHNGTISKIKNKKLWKNIT